MVQTGGVTVSLWVAVGVPLATALLAVGGNVWWQGRQLRLQKRKQETDEGAGADSRTLQRLSLVWTKLDETERRLEGALRSAGEAERRAGEAEVAASGAKGRAEMAEADLVRVRGELARTHDECEKVTRDYRALEKRSQAVQKALEGRYYRLRLVHETVLKLVRTRVTDPRLPSIADELEALDVELEAALADDWPPDEIPNRNGGG